MEDQNESTIRSDGDDRLTEASRESLHASSAKVLLEVLSKFGLISRSQLAVTKFDPGAPSLQQLMDHLVANGEIGPVLRKALEEMLADSSEPLGIAASTSSPAERSRADPEVGQDPTASLVGSTGATDETTSPSMAGPLGSNQQEASPSVAKRFGDYEILDEIARGGMGVVYKARQISLNRLVALKKIRAGQLAGEEEMKRFRFEAEASAKLDHPGIVPVYDFGEIDGQPFFSMGLVDGTSLADRIRESPFEPRHAAALLIKVSRAVAYANDKGLIHRDLKPGNVLLDQSGEPRVSDFGLAKQQTADSGMTATGQILGTPSYMPPEQAAGEREQVDQRADVYALGAILYATLTGRPPFQAASAVETINLVLHQEPVSIKQLVPGVPRDLETICLKALQKEPNKRYNTANDLADDLQRWLDGEPIVARRVSRVERAWKWCQRKPFVVGSMATVVSLLILGSLIFWERQNAAHVDGLVNSLVNADAAQVPPLVAELSEYWWWAEPRLRNRLKNSREGSTEELHLSLALLSDDTGLAGELLEELLSTAEREYVAVILDALLDADVPLEEVCWSRFRSVESSDDERFRAGVVLARLVPQSKRWTDADYQLLIDELAVMNVVYQPQFWPLLTNLRDRLLPKLEELFRSTDRTEIERVSAANAIAYYAANDLDRLERLLLIATGPRFQILFEKYENVVNEASRGRLRASIKRQPTNDLNAESRIALGKQRATSAITLLRLGERESILDVLRYTDDPEALTQFVHCCRACGVIPAELIELLEETDQRRGELDGDRQKIDDSVMYGLLLALGDFAWDDLPATRVTLVRRLALIYEKDPSSGVHSATGWLLRQWDRNDVVEQVDQTPRPYDSTGHREWYVQQIEYESGGVRWFFPDHNKLHLTFIVFQPNKFSMGSPDNEPYHEADEAQHQVTLTRPIAVVDRELTWAQWMAMEGVGRRDAFASHFSQTLKDRDPVFGVTWFESVRYCRWLSERAGIPDDDQCYMEPSTLPKDAEGNPTDWPLRLEGDGFRLPTEAEWEFICRGGTCTAWSFGHDEQLLDRYAWNLKNSADWSHATGELRPNARGLFDIHGNLYEWCHDWYEENVLTDATDPRGANTGRDRVNRGGSWYDIAKYCRSATRYNNEPSLSNYLLGFRLVTVPSSP